jgi:hypothetical protein
MLQYDDYDDVDDDIALEQMTTGACLTSDVEKKLKTRKNGLLLNATINT